MFTAENYDINEYILDAHKLMVENHDEQYLSTCKEYEVFGNKILMTTDELIHHIHLKLNDECNAKCKFCIESGRSCSKVDSEKYLARLEDIFKEFESKGLLYSISITGGEPMLSKLLIPVLNVIDKHNFKMVTMNSNAYMLPMIYHELSQHKIDCINISRHHYDDEINKYIFGSEKIPSVDTLKDVLKEYRRLNPKTKFRFQCIMVKYAIDNLKEINYMTEVFKDVVDDFSFRQQMSINDNYDSKIIDFYNKTFIPLQPILREIYHDGRYEFTYQRIVDYYCYEGWRDKVTGKELCFSYSNMDMLTKSEEVEPDNLIREFIYFYDGKLSGSWLGDKKVLLESFER